MGQLARRRRGSARRRQAQETFATARNELPGTARAEVTLRVVEAKDAARTVCDYAREHDFDLVVLGRHGVGGTFRPGLGHIAHAAARNSEVPLLLTTQPRLPGFPAQPFRPVLRLGAAEKRRHACRAIYREPSH